MPVIGNDYTINKKTLFVIKIKFKVYSSNYHIPNILVTYRYKWINSIWYITLYIKNNLQTRFRIMYNGYNHKDINLRSVYIDLKVVMDYNKTRTYVRKVYRKEIVK